MTATLETLEPEASASVDEILGSFVLGRGERWVRVAPLAVLLVVQTLLTLRLHVPLSTDEALYVNDGRYLLDHVLHHSPQPDRPGSYFSGAPALYPVVAGALDIVGGIPLVRVAGLLCMLAATVGVYLLTQRLFRNRWTTVLAAALFVVAGPVGFLGHFATFDAPVAGMVAVAAAWSVRQAQRDTLWSAPALGVLLALTALTKYAGFAFVPVVLALGIVVSWQVSRWRTLARAALAAVAGTAFVAVLDLLWGGSVRGGIEGTTVARTAIQPASTGHLLAQLVAVAGPYVVLSAIGALALAAMRRPVLALLLLGGSWYAVLYQAVRLHEEISLTKHVTFGLVFAAPLGAYGITAAMRALRGRRWQRPVGVALAAALLATGIDGLAVSRSYHYASLTFATDQIRTELVADPQARVVVDSANVVRLRLRDVAPFQSFTDTDYIAYEGQHGIAGFEAAFDDRLYDLVVLNTSNGLSRQLDALMPAYGFELVATQPVFRYDTYDWHVWRLVPLPG